jgi:hypothetical protein
MTLRDLGLMDSIHQSTVIFHSEGVPLTGISLTKIKSRSLGANITWPDCNLGKASAIPPSTQKTIPLVFRIYRSVALRRPSQGHE